MRITLMRLGCGLLLVILVLVFFFISTFSGGVKGFWYDITKPTFDPLDSNVREKSENVKNRIVTDFDFLNSLPQLTLYGVHNTDLCAKTDYSYKQPIGWSNSLYTCTYTSQRYYGIDRMYDDSVKSLIEHVTKNKKGLIFQEYDLEQIFLEKDWVKDPATIKKLISSHNLANKDKPAKDIYDVISFIEGRSKNYVSTYKLSDDGYNVELYFFDHGELPSRTDIKGIYNSSDTPDLREEYISEIVKTHPYGMVVTITSTYFAK